MTRAFILPLTLCQYLGLKVLFFLAFLSSCFFSFFFFVFLFLFFSLSYFIYLFIFIICVLLFSLSFLAYSASLPFVLLFHYIRNINHFYPRVLLSIQYTEAHFYCSLCRHSVKHQALEDVWVLTSHSQVLLPPLCKCFKVCWSQTNPEKLRVTKRTAAILDFAHGSGQESPREL